MKNLKRTTAILGLISLLAFNPAFAQEAKPHKHPTEAEKANREKQFAETAKRLNLTDDQLVKIKAIREQNKTEMKALKEANQDKTKDEKRALMIGQLKKTDGQINAILDQKQQAIYKEIKAERKAAMKEKRAENKKNQETIDELGGIL